MQEHEDAGRYDYPLGRGYGHDYMRGGEVLGGYGYSERDEYERPRGDTGDGAALPEDDQDQPVTPRDEFAGAATEPSLAPATAAPPIKPLRHIYGSTGQRHHSRSFYVTQAQVLGRLYGPERYGRAEHGPYHDRVSARSYEDAELRHDVEEALFHDTWVDSGRVRVEVERGVVTLRGALRSYEEIRYACDDAWDVPGVRGVRCELAAEE